MTSLSYINVDGLTLLAPSSAADAGGVACAFSTRRGGVSAPPFDSLNLGRAVGDDPSCVAENARRFVSALAAHAGEKNANLEGILQPKQVHGNNVLLVDATSDMDDVRAQAAAGADAIVCTRRKLPVLLAFADCVPIIVVAPHAGFAVIHAGWRGCANGIIGSAIEKLVEASGTSRHEMYAYVGPHIGAGSYEISAELIEKFQAMLPGVRVCFGERQLDLTAVVAAELHEAGIVDAHVGMCVESTATFSQLFYSYRASGGACGRHGALACMF